MNPKSKPDFMDVSAEEASLVCGGVGGIIPPIPALDVKQMANTGPVKDICSSIGPLPPIPTFGM